MAQIINNISLDVAKANNNIIYAKQNDVDSRFLKVSIYNKGVRLSINSTATVTINARRTDGEAKAFLGTVNADGTVTVPLNNWMLALGGNLDCDISIIEDNKKLSTTAFHVMVEEATYGNDDISEDETYDLILQVLEETQEVKETCETYADNAEGSAANARNAQLSAQGSASQANNYANNARNSQLSAQASASQATQSAQITAHPPRINQNGNWDIWNTTTGAYADSGVQAVGADGEDGVSIVNATVDANGHLIETLSDGTTIDCGYVGSGGGVIYTAGDNITISQENVISATDTTYGVATQQTNGLMSSTDKAKLDGIEAGAEANDIDTVKVNGTALIVTNKAIDIPVPTKTSDLTNDSGFLTQHQDISGKENTSNKVPTLSQSSTDTQYPSAKCVYAGLETKEDKTTILTSASTTPVQELAHNTEYRFSEDLTSFTITFPASIPDDYIVWLVFKSGATATSFIYPSNIKWSGDDIVSGEFVPSASTTYNVCLWYDGMNINGIARGIS